MKILNSSGLPQSVFEALSRKEYSKDGADISVTELIDSPRVRVLKNQNSDKIEIEAETLLASFLGTCFHKGIELGTKTGTAERRLFIEVSGWKLSGGMDHYHEGTLLDYKTATCFKVSLDCPDGRVEDWENQLNVYAHILRANGHPVTGLKLFCFFKDWNRRSFATAAKAGKIFTPGERGGYPDKTWVYFDVPLWSEEQAESYVLERVRLHQEAEKTLPLCAPKDIWNGNRCRSYCNASPFCQQFAEQSKTGLKKKEEK
jgi:hypothetical protein